jgi:hypothetical protein
MRKRLVFVVIVLVIAITMACSVLGDATSTPTPGYYPSGLEGG